MSLESMMKERDKLEGMENRYFPNKLPEIERNDELDYEITQILMN